MFQAKKQQLLNKVWRKVAEYNYPDFVHVVVPLVMGACDPQNCAGTGHVEGHENGGKEVGEGSAWVKMSKVHFLFHASYQGVSVWLCFVMG